MRDVGAVDFERGADGVLVARLSGELDLANLDAVRRRIEQELAADAGSLIVDLTGVAFLDSSGIQLLFRLRDALESRQMRLLVVIPEGAYIRSALGVADRTELLDVVVSIEEAKRLLAA